WLAEPEHLILKDNAITSEEKTAWRNPSGAPSERGWLELVSGATFVRATGGQTLVLMSTNENKTTASPGLIVANHGKGRVAYLPAVWDRPIFYYPNTYIAEMLVNATRWGAADPKPPLETDAPLMLAVTYRRQPAQKRAIVHLLNDQSSYGRHSI